MKEYAIQQLDNKEYDSFLLCLTFESILNYIEQIEHEQLILKSKGVLLVDQLLVTGNGKNRFILCSFDHGKIDLSTVRTIYPHECYRKISIDLLQKNFELLHNSILTDRQRENIKHGILF
ncbi:type II toxin-antitoxin system RnlB family antitoxin [Phascolarctobacterium sp. Marseille-Q4147]|uniref:type II toxin-antitoxin system RnlB family antitoxin n=1 Tax=Phascolarctobacterium sp. Marseille-Q4147 TaxID=2823317 RepID=UPI001B325910|nr:type II toxin-antitoxin system RnlB family antitoxin [Phascolarctobacterium sp. Marseille-Q4147]QTV78825.1 type II toxin-antitoxin system RnlB family antitoxin [Phascolarctobacterium sp. Marseille-Q4147]